MKKLLITPVRPVLAGGAKRAKIPDIAEIIREKLCAIGELEREKTASVDMPGELFGELLGEVFAYGLSERDALICREFGKSLGRFIYAADAAEDYEDDRVSGKYNPYVLLYGSEPLTDENKQSIKCGLLLECKKMESAVNLMPFGNRATIENIIRNIIYAGLPKRIEFLDTKNENDCKDCKCQSKNKEKGRKRQ